MSDAPTLEGSKVVLSLITMGAAFLALVDLNILTVALPHIRVTFGADLDELGWVTTAYMMASVVAMPAVGWFARRFGFPRVFAIALLVFVFGSILAALAPSFFTLVAARAAQGIGGGALIPLAQSMLLARFPREEHGRAGAIFGIGAMLGPVIGPSIGGHLLEHVAWPYLFWVNVPLGLVIVAATLANVRERARPETRPPVEPFDVEGFAYLAVGLPALQFVLEEGNRRDWLASREVAVAAALSAIALPALLVHGVVRPQAILDLRVFRHLRYTMATILNVAIGVAMISGAFLNVLFFGAALGYSAVDIGDILLYGNVVDFVAIPVSAYLLRRVDARPILLVGFVLLVASLFLNARLGLDAQFWQLTFPHFVRSSGSSLLYVPITVVALSGLTEPERTSAVGLFNLTRELGASIGTAVLAHLVTARTREHEVAIAEASRHGLGFPPWLGARLAFTWGFSDTFVAVGVVIALLLPCTLLLRGRGELT